MVQGATVKIKLIFQHYAVYIFVAANFIVWDTYVPLSVKGYTGHICPMV